MQKSNLDLKVEEYRALGYITMRITTKMSRNKRLRNILMQNGKGEQVILDHDGKVIPNFVIES